MSYGQTSEYLPYKFSLALHSLLSFLVGTTHHVNYPIIVISFLLYHNFSIIPKQKRRIFNKNYKISYILSCCRITLNTSRITHKNTTLVDKSINYICNPDKTDEKILISSFACSPETTAIDFKYTLDHCRENSPSKAYHLIQAFAPGEVSYEEAHQKCTKILK